MEIRIPGQGTKEDKETWVYYNDDNVSIDFLCDPCWAESGLRNDPWVSGGTRQDRAIVTERFLRFEWCRLGTQISHIKHQMKRVREDLQTYELDSECYSAEDYPRKREKKNEIIDLT